MTVERCQNLEQEIYDELVKELFDGIHEIDESELKFDNEYVKDLAYHFILSKEERRARYAAERRKRRERLQLRNMLQRLSSMIQRERRRGDPLRIDIAHRILKRMLILGQSTQLDLVNSHFGRRDLDICDKILRELTSLVIPDQLKQKESPDGTRSSETQDAES